MSLDTRTLEVLISRVCHDLISPISAVSNGAELIADMGLASADDAFDLIRSSASAASVKLQTFRLAYGAGGSEWHVSMDDVEKAFSDYLALEPRYRLEWAVIGSALPQPLPRGFAKLAILALMWGMESLPKGGKIAIRGERESDDRFSLVIDATGDNAAVREGVEEAFAGTVQTDLLTPKTVHAAVTGHYARSYGIDVTFGLAAPDQVQLRVSARL